MPDDATSRFTRKGRATRGRIVDVAAKLMFQRGVAGTSIDEVRNTAAVSGSQISHYFHDKRDLTRQVIAARCTESSSGARNVENILTRTLLPELSGEVLARLADGEAIRSVHAGIKSDGLLFFAINKP